MRWTVLPLAGLLLLGGCALGEYAAAPLHAPAGIPAARVEARDADARPAARPSGIDARLLACLPERLHPVSRMFLDAWLVGTIGTPTFRRFFHMPNSDYLEVSECLVAVREAIPSTDRFGKKIEATLSTVSLRQPFQSIRGVNREVSPAYRT